MKALPTFEEILFLCLLHEKCHLLTLETGESISNMASHRAASPSKTYVVLSILNLFTFVMLSHGNIFLWVADSTAWW